MPNINSRQVDIKLSKKDVAELFESPAPKTIPKMAKWIGLFVLIIIIGYLIINAPALYHNIKYSVYTDLLNRDYDSNYAGITVTADQPITNVNNQLIIPKIGVNSQIQWGVNQTQLSKTLADGPVQLKKSNLPDEFGNVFIVGHSSYYFWPAKQNAAVFSLLNKLEIGDSIIVIYGNKNFIYKVNSKTISSSKTIDIKKPADEKILTLMTYYPIGIPINKLLIEAELENEIDLTKKKPANKIKPIKSEQPTMQETYSTEENLKFLPE